MVEKDNDCRPSFLFQRPITTTNRHNRPVIDPVVLIILMLSILVLLFLFCLLHIPKAIKPISFKSTLSSFNLSLVLLAILFDAFASEDNDHPTNRVEENYQNRDVNDVNDTNHFDDTATDEANDAPGSSDDQRTPATPPVPPYQYLIQSILENKRKSKRFHPVTTAPPPPRSSFDNLFTSGGKNEKLHSSKTSSLPPRPPPPPQHHISPQEYNRQSLSIPEPPPQSPFKKMEMRYEFLGDQFYYSTTSVSGSPDFEAMDQPSTIMNDGDSFCTSPDVNDEADSFIFKRKAKWEMDM